MTYAPVNPYEQTFALLAALNDALPHDCTVRLVSSAGGHDALEVAHDGRPGGSGNYLILSDANGNAPGWSDPNYSHPWHLSITLNTPRRWSDDGDGYVDEIHYSESDTPENMIRHAVSVVSEWAAF